MFIWLVVETSKPIRENIHTPPPPPLSWYSLPRGIFVIIARDFQIILKLELSNLTLDFVWVDFYIEICQPRTRALFFVKRILYLN